VANRAIGLAGTFIAYRCSLACWAGELVCGFRSLQGNEETPPTCRIAAPCEGCKARALATEQKRNVHPALGDDALVRR
jgi:hypothetical protein